MNYILASLCAIGGALVAFGFVSGTAIVWIAGTLLVIVSLYFIKDKEN